MKKHILLVLTCGLVLGSTVGVYANEASRLRSTGIINYNNGSIVMDGDAIGYWITGTETAPIATLSSGKKVLKISDSGIKEDSSIEIYYKEADKDAVSKAGVSYSQTNGSVTVTFKKAPAADIHIVSMHIVNPQTSKSGFSVEESDS